MTTDFRQMYAADISQENEVFNIPKNHIPSGIVLSAMSWTQPGSYCEDKDKKILQKILNHLLTGGKSHVVWLCIGNSSWIPDNRIERYKKLWRRLEGAGIYCTDEMKKKEFTQERPGEVRYFGALKIENSDWANLVHGLMLWDNNSFIVVTPKDSDIDIMLEEGWSDFNLFNEFLINIISWRSFLMIKKYDNYDLFDCGYFAIGKKTQVSNIFDEILLSNSKPIE